MADTHEKPDSRRNDRACCFFEIRVRGYLSREWSDWFEDMDIKLLENGETVLSGPIGDQAALMGILNKLNRINLRLVSLNEVSRNGNVTEGEGDGATASTESQI